MASYGSGGSIRYMNHEMLTTFPPDVLNDEVKVIHAKHNLIKTLPPTVSLLVNLVELNLDSNMIETLPIEMAFLNNLQKLDLSKNKLRTIPEPVFGLGNLRSLSLCQNEITYVDLGISKLRQLETLMLANNKLSVLPLALCACVGLKNLNLSSNYISVVPKEIVRLRNLEKLSLPYNKIKLVPFNIPLMSRVGGSLKELDLYHNHLLVFPSLCSLKGVECHLKRVPRLYSTPLQDGGEPEVDLSSHLVSTAAKLSKSHYQCELVLMENSSVSLKELAFRRVGRLCVDAGAGGCGNGGVGYAGVGSGGDYNLPSENHLYFQQLPRDLVETLQCPSGMCERCGCFIYQQCFYEVRSKMSLIAGTLREDDESNELIVVLLCSGTLGRCIK